ncbi:MAG: hypothetical protein JNM69_27880 [Archangium sp.]|nr:hypothetical protein [Archangium sp.]
MVAIAPVVSLTLWVLEVGTEAHSNDYVLWAPVLKRLFEGTLPWSSYFRATFLGGCHSFALPVLVTTAIAALTHWSIRATLMFAIALAMAKVGFFTSAFTVGAPRWQRLLALPVISWLLFSPANVEVFTFGFTATHVGLAEVLFAMCVWAIAKFHHRGFGWALSIIGATLATWSWGSGLLVWPVVAGAWLLYRRRVGTEALAFALWSALALAPYALFSNLAETAPVKRDWWLPLEAFGWPWSGNFDHLRARWVGVIGVVLFGLCTAAFWRRHVRLRPAIPAVACLLYSMGLMVVLAVFRGQLNPWYSTTCGLFWVGLFGVFLVGSREAAQPVLALTFGLALLLAINGGYESKARYLRSRGFTAASCLRNFRTAPAVCEAALFQWKRGNPQDIWVLGETLEKHGWGVFAPHQLWTLQGDYALENVEIETPPGAPEPAWRGPDGALVSQLFDYRPLDLLLAEGVRVHWQVRLPAALDEARFRMKLRADEGARVRLWASSTSGRTLLMANWLAPGIETDFDLSLLPWQDTQVRLSLETDGADDDLRSPLVLSGTRIELTLADTPRKHQLSYAVPFPRVSSTDVVLSPQGPWSLADARRVGANRFTGGNSALVRWQGPLDVCLSDLRAISVTGAPSADVRYRELHVYYLLDGETATTEAHSFYMSMFSGPPRPYSVNVRLLGQPQGARLTGLALRFPMGPSGQGEFELSEVRLERRDGPTRCREHR